MNKLNKKGFTLIEMLVVIAIIAVLVSIIVPVVSNSTTKAAAATDAANLRSVAATAAIEYLEKGTLTADNYTVTAKSSGAGALKIYNDNGAIEAYFGTYGVEDFAAVADGTNTTLTDVEPKGVPSGTALVDKTTP